MVDNQRDHLHGRNRAGRKSPSLSVETYFGWWWLGQTPWTSLYNAGWPGTCSSLHGPPCRSIFLSKHPLGRAASCNAGLGPQGSPSGPDAVHRLWVWGSPPRLQDTAVTRGTRGRPCPAEPSRTRPASQVPNPVALRAPPRRGGALGNRTLCRSPSWGPKPAACHVPVRARGPRRGHADNPCADAWPRCGPREAVRAGGDTKVF